jgi:hypothetical protein
MKIIKGLVANSISGSTRFTHDDASLIAVTGAVVFAKHSNQHTMPSNDVFFHVAGTPGDGSTVASIGGDLTVTGSINLLDDAFMPVGILHVGESPEQMRISVSDGTGSIDADNDLSIYGANIGIDASNGRIQFKRGNENYVQFDMIPGNNDIRIESDGMIILQGTEIINNSIDGKVIFQNDGTDRLQIDMSNDSNDLIVQSSDVLVLSGSSVLMDSSSGLFGFSRDGIDFLTFDAATNSILPGADKVVDLGSSSRRFANVYTGDLHLRNERGHWQIVEEADCLTIYNRLTDVRYKFVLERYDEVI